MCGRYVLTLSGHELAVAFELDEVPATTPRYNVAPTQTMPVVRAAAGRREGALLRWGLVPSWADDSTIGARLINARAETAATKPSFRAAFRHRRCLVPADGFYEWRKTTAGKVPHFIHFRDGRPFAFAGLWERWQPREGAPVESFTILTTEPNDVIAPLHARMPVIIGPGDYDCWLGLINSSAHELRRLLVPFPPEGMEAYPVTRWVNAPAHDDPACIEPLP